MNAKDAKERAISINNTRNSFQLKNIISEIETQAGRGCFSLTRKELNSKVEKALKAMGYEVTFFSDVREPNASHYSISWN